MYDWKLLEQKTIQQAEQIGEDPEDWAEIFTKLGLECTARSTNNVVFECPVCQPKGKRRGITFNTIPTSKPYPQWRCHDHPATRKYFGSHIGLVRFLMEHVKGEKVLSSSNSPKDEKMVSTKSPRKSITPSTEVETESTPMFDRWPFDEAEARLRQKKTSKAIGQPIDFTNSIGMKFKLIPAGEFIMGSPEDEKGHNNNEQQHSVRITKPYYLGVFEVTQGEFTKVMSLSPWKMKKRKEGMDYPASCVSWGEAAEFCRKLSAKEGRIYRLPTESEWEYACRAGSNTAYSFGNTLSNIKVNAWYSGNAWHVGENYAHRVGLKQVNAFDLYDMHGNVWEWCADWFDNDYYKKSAEADPIGPKIGSFRVHRGGSWDSSEVSCRSALRNNASLTHRYGNLGFRVAMDCEATGANNISARNDVSKKSAKTTHEIKRRENVALASNGTTVSGNFVEEKWSKREWSSCMIDGKTETKHGAGNYAAGKLPAEWIVTFKETYRLQEIRLKLWDNDKRFYQYAIATSVNGKNYVPLVDRSQGEWRGWQVIRFPKPRPVKFVKILGLHCNKGPFFHIVEFEAYCVPTEE